MKTCIRPLLGSVAVVAILFIATTAPALAPPTPEQLAQYRADGTLSQRVESAERLGNDRVDPALVSALNARMQGTQGDFRSLSSALPWQTSMAASGAPKVLAVCIDFSDYPASIPSSTIQARLDGQQNALDAAYPFESLRAFYQRSSHDALDLRTDTYGWYRSPVPRSDIATTGASRDNLAATRENLIASALRYYDDQGVDFSQYDNNHDGKIDYMMVYWTGPKGPWASFWWGYKTNWTATSLTLDGVRPMGYSWQWPSDGNQSVTIHETGHALGLPDLYDYDASVGATGGVGGFDMMHSNNVDHNAFSKWLLGWSLPTLVKSGTTLAQLRVAADTGDAIVVMPGASAASIFSECFVVENRQPVGNDKKMVPDPGLTVWHVDARLAPNSSFAWNNSYTEHKYIAVEQADGLGSIESRGSSFDAADTWRAGASFTPASTPASARYDGSASGVTVDSIAFVGTTATLRASIDGAQDLAAPVTVASPSPANAFAEWVASNVTLVLSATDDVSGIAWTRYSLNGAAEQDYNGAPFTVSAEGITTVRYRSQDNSGNAETAATKTIAIDKTPPVTSVSNPQPSYGSGSGAVITLAGSDAHSGVKSTAWRIGTSGAFSAGTSVPVPVAAGSYTLQYYSVDLVGNAEGVKTAVVAVVPGATSTRISGASSVRAKRALKLVGTVSPSGTAGTVRIVKSRWVRGRWRSAGSATVNVVNGSYHYNFKTSTRGKWRLAATYSGGAGGSAQYAASNSVAKYVRVR